MNLDPKVQVGPVIQMRTAPAIAGLFTLLPGRIMSNVLFGDAPWLGFGLVAVALLAVYTRSLISRRSNVE